MTVGLLARSRLHITHRSKPAFRSLRDEALTKFGEFIGAGSFPSVIRPLLARSRSRIGSQRGYISSPAQRNVFRFWTNAPENLCLDSKCEMRKGKSLRRRIWNWLLLQI